MAENSIPEELKSDHLFLLVGGNPLPNWVAARLLLREGGQVYLVHSNETRPIADKLIELFVGQSFKRPALVSVGEASDATKVYDAVSERIKKINSRQIGFNYTGGTKVMAVHGFLAVKENTPPGGILPIYSYLDAQTLEMHFDHWGKPIPVQLNDRVHLTLDELLNIQFYKGWSWEKNKEPKRELEPVLWDAAQKLAVLHKNDIHYDTWKKHFGDYRNKSNEDLMKMSLNWPPPLTELAQAIVQKPDIKITLQQLCEDEACPFDKPTQLFNWLDGKWLEHYVLGILIENKQRFSLNDWRQGFEIRVNGNKMEIDVAAIRGYQLHIFSCTKDDDKKPCKLKLFEAFMRAKQIGGEEACAALVCLSEEPGLIESDARQTWQAHGRVKVFGRPHLHKLAEELENWFCLPIS
jgi:hypothetical protein